MYEEFQKVVDPGHIFETMHRVMLTQYTSLHTYLMYFSTVWNFDPHLNFDLLQQRDVQGVSNPVFIYLERYANVTPDFQFE